MHEAINRIVNSRLTCYLTGATVFLGSTFEYIHLQPGGREFLGPIIGEHIGNFSFSSYPILGATAIGVYIENEGIKRGSNLLEAIGRSIPYIAVTMIGVANFINEKGFLTNYSTFGENMGDIGMGLFAILAASLLAQHLRPRWLNYLANNT
ncbi:hypothetical protein HY357_02000 [Candidatus Roizmanbacteria bacterium]|nr:hypothetical protein [Candidatus Roizmanbacteria bacterium]